LGRYFAKGDGSLPSGIAVSRRGRVIHSKGAALDRRGRVVFRSGRVLFRRGRYFSEGGGALQKGDGIVLRRRLLVEDRRSPCLSRVYLYWTQEPVLARDSWFFKASQSWALDKARTDGDLPLEFLQDLVIETSRLRKKRHMERAQISSRALR
jgi:hypothetical protein